MDIVSVINYKGGVGKTTTTANLAAQLAWTGKNVLMIDLDPQASLTFSFIQPDVWEANLAEAHTIKRWFDTVREGDELNMNNLLFEQMYVNEVLRQRGRGRLALIPSHLGLINVDLELATHLGAASLAQGKRNYVRVHGRLARGLASLDQDAFDVVFIDCPPNFNIVTKTAIVASHQVLVPAKPDYLSTLGITYLQRNLDELVRDFNEYAVAEVGDAVDEINPQILGVIFTMVQFYSQVPIAAHRSYMNQIRTLDTGVPVFDSYVRENKTAFGEAPEMLLPVVLKSYTGRRTRILLTSLSKSQPSSRGSWVPRMSNQDNESIRQAFVAMLRACADYLSALPSGDVDAFLSGELDLRLSVVRKKGKQQGRKRQLRSMLHNYLRLRHVSVPWKIVRRARDFCVTLPLRSRRWRCLRGTWMLRHDVETG